MAVGQEALWEASLNYDAEKAGGSSFWAFARYRVKGAVLDELRSWDHVSRGARTKVKDENIESISWALIYPQGLTPAHGIAVADNPEENVAKAERMAKLMGAVKELPRREKQVIEGVLVKHRSEAEISRKMKISQGRVSQLKKEALLKLRAFVQEKLR
jgi:RNA polymerase sigma factor for flagellar operon FliA